MAYVLEDYTLRQAAEKLTFHHYTALPILSEDGKYIGTVSEGDLFRYVKNSAQMNYREAEDTPVCDVPIQREVNPIKSDCNIEDLYHIILNQNFVPVLDDQGIFIGIVTRKSVLGYVFEQLKKQDK
ncbi:MAG: CBS domain-containing protein [Bacilli bacterium]